MLYPHEKYEDQLAHDIRDAAEILYVYCEKHEQDNYEVAVVTTLTEYILILSKELCKRF